MFKRKPKTSRPPKTDEIRLPIQATPEEDMAVNQNFGEFLEAMIAEYNANGWKGGRTAYLENSEAQLIWQVLYHGLKLAHVVLNEDTKVGDREKAILEFAADTANQALFVVDKTDAWKDFKKVGDEPKPTFLHGDRSFSELAFTLAEWMRTNFELSPQDSARLTDSYEFTED